MGKKKNKRQQEIEPPPSAEPGTLSTLHAGIAVLALLIGMVLSLQLIQIKLALDFDPDFVSSCNFGTKLNCDAVQTHPASTVLGKPLALWGLATYAFLALLTLVATRVEPWGRKLHGVLITLGLITCLHALYLAYVSTVIIGAYCVFCLGMYAVNGIFTGALIHAWPGRLGGLKQLPGSFALPGGALATLGGLAALCLLVAVPSYDVVRQGKMEARLAVAKAEIEATQAQRAAESSAAATAAKNGDRWRGSRDQGGGAAPDQSKAITRKGRAFYEAAITDLDFPLGPADAPVTVVEFADFGCGYCRRLSENLKPLKAKYEGEVRWIFKHFPLDMTCNKKMRSEMHKNSCAAARAANCAGEQDLFWPMHDQLFAHQHQFGANQLRGYARDVGVDLSRWESCVARSERDQKIDQDVDQAIEARVFGTPRTFINGHLVAGAAATEVIDYYLEAALKLAREGGAEQAAPAKPLVPAGTMIAATSAGGEFWIDAYEGSLAVDGRALTQPKVQPAEVSWIEAKDACAAAGKRLCSEEEWVSACTGAPAIDDDASGSFADDAPQGLLFPYGPFYKGGYCNDNQHKERGKAVPTGAFAHCRSESGIYDMSGNLAEWTGASPTQAAVTGSFFTAGSGATCRGRSERFGPGYRNKTTGFRCCADSEILPSANQAGGGEYRVRADRGDPVPSFAVTTRTGATVTDKDLRGQVTILTFFASWCGPCRRELPALNKFFAENEGKGLKILAVGVDKEREAAESFVSGLDLAYQVAFDEEAVSMGRFGVKGMPTAFVIDKGGVIRHRLTGIKAEELKRFKETALKLLSKP